MTTDAFELRRHEPFQCHPVGRKLSATTGRGVSCPTTEALKRSSRRLDIDCRDRCRPAFFYVIQDCGQFRDLDRRIQQYDVKIRSLAQQSEPARRLMQMDAIGPQTATALVASMGDPHVFKSARNYAASLGLTPRQDSSGGTTRLGPITKQGDRYLRTLLVHGARAYLRFVARKSDGKSAWAPRLKERRHVNVAAVALAAKHARIAWAMLARGTEYRPVQPAEAAA